MGDITKLGVPITVVVLLMWTLMSPLLQDVRKIPYLENKVENVHSQQATINSQVNVIDSKIDEIQLKMRK